MSQTAVPRAVEQAMYGFVVSQCLFVCDKLGVFAALGSGEIRSLEALAASTGAPAEPLLRLLIATVSAGLLESPSPRHYRALPDLRDALNPDHAAYVGMRFPHYYETSYPMFAHLLDAVQTGRPQWEKVGKSLDGGIYQSAVFSDPQSTRSFVDSMWASGYDDSKVLCAKMDLESARYLVDLGGASGSFAVAALETSPSLRAAVYDLPPMHMYVCERGEKHAVGTRLSFISGDFFTDPLPTDCDFFVIGYVLSDWPEDRCRLLLQRVYDALLPGGRIAVLEKFLSDALDGPFLTAALNLTMLVEMEGGHHTAREYARWMTDVGFAAPQRVCSGGEKNALLACKREAP